MEGKHFEESTGWKCMFSLDEHVRETTLPQSRARQLWHGSWCRGQDIRSCSRSKIYRTPENKFQSIMSKYKVIIMKKKSLMKCLFMQLELDIYYEYASRKELKLCTWRSLSHEGGRFRGHFRQLWAWGCELLMWVHWASGGAVTPCRQLGPSSRARKY